MAVEKCNCMPQESGPKLDCGPIEPTGEGSFGKGTIGYRGIYGNCKVDTKAVEGGDSIYKQIVACRFKLNTGKT